MPLAVGNRGFALFLLDRLQIGRGGTAGPSLVKLVGAKAAQGMSVVIVQGVILETDLGLALYWSVFWLPV